MRAGVVVSDATFASHWATSLTRPLPHPPTVAGGTGAGAGVGAANDPGLMSLQRPMGALIAVHLEPGRHAMQLVLMSRPLSATSTRSIAAREKHRAIEYINRSGMYVRSNIMI